jgi:hypothetical protein
LRMNAVHFGDGRNHVGTLRFALSHGSPRAILEQRRIFFRF